MDAPATVRTDQQGPVRTITLDRPERRNAVDGPTALALRAAFEAFEADDSARVAVLTGAGGHFCAGADLQALGDPQRRNPIEPTGSAPGPMGPTRMAFTKPVIAAVEGYAVAGGLELALMCDLRIAARSATFGVFCRRWGVPLIDGGTVRLPRIVGMGRALDMILSGRPVGADEAMLMGLATQRGGRRPGAGRGAGTGTAHRCLSAVVHERRPCVGLCAMGSAAGRGAATRGCGGLPGGAGRGGGRRGALCRRCRTARRLRHGLSMALPLANEQARRHVLGFTLADADAAFVDDPYPTYAALREHDPVHASRPAAGC